MTGIFCLPIKLKHYCEYPTFPIARLNFFLTFFALPFAFSLSSFLGIILPIWHFDAKFTLSG